MTLTPEEAAKLGLPPGPTAQGALSSEEAAALGLPPDGPPAGPSYGESFARAGVNAMYAGFEPAIAGSNAVLAESNTPEEMGALSAPDTAPPPPSSLKGPSVSPTGAQAQNIYDVTRNRERVLNEKARAAHPVTSFGGSVLGGSIPLLIAPPLGAATALGRIGIGAATAGVLGTVQGAGESQADTAGGVLKDAATTGALSLLIGGAGGALVEGVGYGLGKLIKGAPARIVDSLRPTSKELEVIRDELGGKDAVGQALADNGYAANKTIRDVADWAAEKKAELGARMGEIDAAADAKLGPIVDVEKILGLAEKEAAALGNRTDDVNNAAANHIRAWAERTREIAERLGGVEETAAEGARAGARFVPSPDGLSMVEVAPKAAENPKLTMSAAHDVEQQLAGLANWNTETPGLAQDAYRSLNRAMSDAVDGAAEQAGLGADWVAANSEWRVFRQVAKIANRVALNEERKNPFGFLDKLGLAAAAGKLAAGQVHAAAVDAGMVGLHALWNEYGQNLSARLMAKLASTPEELGPWAATVEKAFGKGVGNGLAKHFSLMESEPAYARIASKAGIPEFRPTEADLGDPHVLGQAHVAHAGLANVLKGGAKAVASPLAALGGIATAQQSLAEKIDRDAGTVVTGSKLPGTNAPGSTVDGTRKIFERRAAQAIRLANDSAAMTATIQSATAGLHDHAPATAQSAGATATRAVQFLAAKLGKHPPEAILTHKWIASPTEIATWNRYYDALDNPTGLLKQAAAGTLTKEAVEAVKTVYPDIYDSMRKAVSSRVTTQSGEPRLSIPYRQRLAISQLLGEDVTGSASPQALQAVQRAYAAPVRPQGGPSAGKGNLTLGDRTMTNTQRIETR